MKKTKAKIVQFSDENKLFPDGSRLVYAETVDKIVIYHKCPFQKSNVYMYDRKTEEIFFNHQKGSNKDKLAMIKLGRYFVENAKEEDLVTIDVVTK